MNSESVDLIATDPPFNSKRVFNAPLGSKAAKQKFDDRWRWDEVTDEWHDLLASDSPAVKEVIEAAVVIEGGSITRKGAVKTGVENSIAAFLAWMAPRVVEMHRLMKPTASLYLHCDDAANSYLRLLLDAVFGRGSFRNEIVWKRTAGAKLNQYASKSWGSNADVVLFYSKTREASLAPYRELTAEEKLKKFKHSDGRGRYFTTGLSLFRRPAHGPRPNLCYEWRGFTAPHASGWTLSKERLEEEYRKGNVVITDDGKLERRKYMSDYPGEPVGNVWTDIPNLTGENLEKTKWATQKPLALYERIVRASSDKDDLVLDPFAGCATTCVAAERLGRRWIGIDIDPVAEGVTMDRLHSQTGLFGEAHNENPVTVSRFPPKRTDVASLSDQKLRLALWNNQGRRCANPYCTSESLRPEDLDLDHRIPKSRGGPDDLTNRMALCRNCNTRKGAKAWGRFLDEDRERLPHPKVGP